MPFDSLPVTSPVIEALREGRARVERGWCQHTSMNAAGAVCALGALGDQYGNLRVPDAGDMLCATAGAQCYADIGNWNDAPERTQADVIALYDKAIDLAVAEEMERRNG